MQTNKVLVINQTLTDEEQTQARNNINATNVTADGKHIDSLTVSNNSILTAGNNQYKLNKVGELSYPYVMTLHLFNKSANDTSESVIGTFTDQELKISTYTSSASNIQLMFTPTGSQRIMFAYDRQGSTNKTMYSAIAQVSGDSPIYSLNIPVGTLTIGSCVIRLTDYVLELEYADEATADTHNLTCVAKWWRI